MFKVLIQKKTTIQKETISEVANYKLDGVGPVDNKPSTDKLHHFVQKKLN